MPHSKTTGPWRRIVCPIDFSSCSRVALSHAADLAGKTGARLMLVHVYQEAVPEAASAPAMAELVREIPQDVRAELDRWKADAQKGGAHEVAAVVVMGPTARAILDCASHEGADVIVMGTHGRGGLKHLVLGSVAEQVIRDARVPVIVVPLRAGAVAAG